MCKNVSPDAEAYLEERGGCASYAAAPGAKMDSHTNISDKTNSLCVQKFLY